ncbi:PREDICTED: G-type lectin S-receptor-like serine/threonine-protein kinase At4g27290 [Ipomoea nil]|uniref:G-type lectin S-receptor-like serine/threonine-protein kinase At4g27290 n=1 Tax=Ipomoea nil TaxID=35883 RepID=UPI0009009553|nr:PREDICTED: G-type lectin S-receptor-like serine/threonine-protein kinase At4g27290 [Ipomoea nil]
MGALLLLLALSFSVHKMSLARDTISSTQSLKYGDTIVSSGGIFEMGFFSPTNNPSHNNIYVGIWFKQMSIRTVVWVANRDTPLTNTSSVALQIISPGRLALVDGNGSQIWRTNITSGSVQNNPVAKLLDSGNLVVKDANANFLWQSFDYPTDTLLPGMRIGKNLVTGLEISVSAWKTETDPGPGQYRTSFDPTGFPQIVFWKGGNKMYRSGPWTGSSWRDLQKWGLFVETSVIINATEVMTRQFSNTSKLIRFVLTSSGTLQLDIGENGTGKWNSFPLVPIDGCDKYGICGPYGNCDNNKNPVCGCLDKFVARDPVEWGSSDFSGGCVRRKPLNSSSSDGYGFKRYSGVKLPDTNVSTFHKNMTLQECNHACFNNISCMAYSTLIISNGENVCLLWFDDLMDIRVVVIPEDGQDLYIRMASSDSDYPSRSKGKKLKIIKLSSSILGGILVLSLASTLIIILYRRKREKIHLNLKWEEDQTLFEVLTITRATDNFSPENKIGEGGYGPVYKGVLDDGKEIAVKRLSKTSKQGLGEFKNEVNSIAKLQHRNLVKLLGWCIQGDEMMLIYEYMPNKSLDSYIFDTQRRSFLDWPKRFNIINGIARGLLYLHQDSRLKIIHRDLKASNILLDIDMNPKISDFGLARSIGLNETGAKTNRIVGTLGYMSPEYAGHGIFSTKSDVFSFGILVLEIVSGKRNRDFSQHQDHYENLVSHAWKLYRDGTSIQLVEHHLDEPHNLLQVLRSIQVGLLCVQHCPEDRPSMSSIVHMLANDVQLPIPKEPGFFTEKRVIEPSSCLDKEKSFSINGLTISSAFHPR